VTDHLNCFKHLMNASIIETKKISLHFYLPLKVIIMKRF